MNVDMTEERLRELMTECDPAQREVVCVSCGYSDRDRAVVHLLLIPCREPSHGGFRAGLYVRVDGRFCSLQDSPQMHVSTEDLEWYLPLVQSFLRTYSGEIPQEEVG